MTTLIEAESIRCYILKQLDILEAESNILTSFLHQDEIVNCASYVKTKEDMFEKLRILADFEKRFGYMQGKIHAFRDLTEKFNI